MKCRPTQLALWICTLSLAISVYGQSNNVGVLASAAGCPPLTQGPFTIFIDNEDNNNSNTQGGWRGLSNSDGNTTLKVCGVDAARFAAVTQPYMLLSLWSSCPSGTIRVTRYVDSEDNNPISNSNVPGLIVGNRDVNLPFCLYPASGQSSAQFPALGWDYGVFAAPGLPGSFGSGFISMDDQDIPWWAPLSSANLNRWCEGTTCSANGANRNYFGILSGGLNTVMSFARISGAVCGNGLCSAGESCSSCSTDCGPCPVCGDGFCGPAENCYTCDLDCGACSVCGDGECGGGENCSSCCADCGLCYPGEICPMPN